MSESLKISSNNPVLQASPGQQASFGNPVSQEQPGLSGQAGTPGLPGPADAALLDQSISVMAQRSGVSLNPQNLDILKDAFAFGGVRALASALTLLKNNMPVSPNTLALAETVTPPDKNSIMGLLNGRAGLLNEISGKVLSGKVLSGKILSGLPFSSFHTLLSGLAAQTGDQTGDQTVVQGGLTNLLNSPIFSMLSSGTMDPVSLIIEQMVTDSFQSFSFLLGQSGFLGDYKNSFIKLIRGYALFSPQFKKKFFHFFENRPGENFPGIDEFDTDEFDTDELFKDCFGADGFGAGEKRADKFLITDFVNFLNSRYEQDILNGSENIKGSLKYFLLSILSSRADENIKKSASGLLYALDAIGARNVLDPHNYHILFPWYDQDIKFFDMKVQALTRDERDFNHKDSQNEDGAKKRKKRKKEIKLPLTAFFDIAFSYLGPVSGGIKIIDNRLSLDLRIGDDARTPGFSDFLKSELLSGAGELKQNVLANSGLDLQVFNVLLPGSGPEAGAGSGSKPGAEPDGPPEPMDPGFGTRVDLKV